MSLQQTYIDSSHPSNRADFDKEGFDRLISEKGREVLLEKAIECPCKGPGTNQLSTCRNCGGFGWLYVNPTQTRMVLSGVDVATKYVPWSEEARGMVAISAMCEESLSYYDKITAIDGESVYGEVITVKQSGANLFAYTAYNIKEIEFAGLFVDDVTKLTKLEPSQYTVEKNIIRITDTNIAVDSSIALRYKHAPTFLIMEFKRETIQSFKLDDKESLLNLPISAFAKRLHYQVKTGNLNSDWLFDNSYVAPDEPTKYAIQLDGEYDFTLIQGDTFDYNISVQEGQSYSTSIAGRVYKMQVRNTAGILILEFIMGDGIEILVPNVVHLHKDSDQTESLPVGTYRYDLQEVDGDSVETILFGNFTVKQQETI